MNALAQRILEDALTLPEEDREQIADSLWRSTHGFTSAEIASEWKEEIARRIRNAEEGNASFIPHDEVMQAMRAKLNSE